MKASRRKIYSFILLLFIYANMTAQTKLPPVGEYYLRGEPETASGFKLNADSTFQFFFSYGALDRSGNGRWQVTNDTIILNSGPKPAHNFKLLAATTATRNRIQVQIKEANPALLRHFYCRIKGGGQQQESMTNEKGIAVFTPQQVDTVEIFFEFCPEKISVFRTTPKGLNSFVFAPEPWLMNVFFQNFPLAITQDGLQGRHPLSDKASFFYQRNK